MPDQLIPDLRFLSGPGAVPLRYPKWGATNGGFGEAMAWWNGETGVGFWRVSVVPMILEGFVGSMIYAISELAPPPRVAPMSSLKLTSERKEAILMTVVSLCLDSQLNFFPVSWLSFPSIGETSVGIFLKRPKASQSYCFNRHLAAPDGLIYGSVPTRWHRAKPMRFEHIFTPCIASDLAATKAEKIQESCWGQDEKNLMRICSFSIVGGFERKPQGK